jgi:hypothetical protein
MFVQHHRLHDVRRTVLVTALASTLSVAAMDAGATCASLVVANCADGGAGSLRSVVACANSGDTVDLSQLVCSTISLASHVDVPQASLTLHGPGAQSLTIDAGDSDRVFLHHLSTVGAGTLFISGLTVAHGSYQSSEPQGGCIRSGGNVTLIGATVEYCSALGTGTQTSAGGAIYAYGNVILVGSTLTGNQAIGTLAGSRARGGAISVNYNLTVKYSTISNNSASAPDSRGGGMYAPRRDITIVNSTISGNAAKVGAAIDASVPSTREMLLSDSTISGNSGTNWPALYTQHPTTIRSSTIAFNTASANSAAVEAFNTTLDLQSSILADNYGGGVAFDLSGSGVTLSGANNLVRSSALTLPEDTMGSCPRLGPLASNGGATLTHALLVGSPAIDFGDAGSLSNDQRGTGFTRAAGTAADIGAYERQTGALDDRIFKSGLELGCDE